MHCLLTLTLIFVRRLQKSCKGGGQFAQRGTLYTSVDCPGEGTLYTPTTAALMWWDGPGENPSMLSTRDWLVGVASKKWVWLVEVGGIYGCGYWVWL